MAHRKEKFRDYKVVTFEGNNLEVTLGALRYNLACRLTLFGYRVILVMFESSTEIPRNFTL